MEKGAGQLLMLMIPDAKRLTGKALAKSMQLTAGIIRAGYKGIDNRRHSIRHWVKKGETLKSIEVTDGNIKSFERTARKYGVKFALKKALRARRGKPNLSGACGAQRGQGIRRI